MKKAFLALVAVAALCLTGCGKNYVEEYLGDYECTMTATINTNELGPVSQSLSSDFTIKEGTNDGEVVLEFTDIDLILRGTVDKEGLHIEQSNLKFKYNIADVDVVPRDELRKWAIPFCSSTNPLITSTWFFISAIKGEMTIAVPGMTRAGSWKQRDFPPPVGMSTNVSFPSRRLRIMAS